MANKKKLKSSTLDKAMISLVIIVLAMLSYNSYAMGELGSAVKPAVESTEGVLPTGIPSVYGAELGVSFDDVSPYDQGKADRTIKILSGLDRSIQLEGAGKERYVNALYRLENGMSCEYCCGARSIIFENGEPACGCAHSYAMRGLAKYLITQHGVDYTDQEIMAEVGKWKARFFPSQIQAKAQILKAEGLETDIASLTSNKYRGIEKGLGSGGMVGGC